jgi:cytochrome c-type biogenesis protein CcsB
VLADIELAKISNNLVNATTVVYALALFGYAADLASGSARRNRVMARQAAKEAVLVGAGGPAVTDSLPEPADTAEVTVEPSRGERAGRIAVSLTVLGVLLHGGAVLTRGLSVHRVPWGNMYEFTLALTFASVAAFLVMLSRQRIRFLGLFVLLPVLLALGVAIKYLYVPASPLVPALQSYWIAIHVSALVIASGVFLVSGTCAILYLFAERDERRDSESWISRYLPSAATLDKVTYRGIAFGFPVWTFGVIAGSLWADDAWGKYWQWDPKETWSFIVWVIFAGYLHARATVGWRGRRAAILALVGLGALLFNFFGVNMLLSGMHSYSGL